MSKQVKMIWAQSRGGVIGKNGVMPWHLPEDLARFKALTVGCPVIMGRKTWDSLPARFRPLPGRRNVVVTRSAEWAAAGAERASSLAQALQACAAASSIWVIGGADIFAQALDPAYQASQIEVTEIDADFAGDAFAPAVPAHWLKQTNPAQLSANGLSYRFVSYRNPQVLSTTHTLA
jgi:dihydrofolate reductase